MSNQSWYNPENKAGVDKKKFRFPSLKSSTTFYTCFRANKHGPAHEVTYSRYGCFPLVSPRAALTQFPPRKPIPAEGHAPAGPLGSRDTFDPMRTDTGRVQPCRTTTQVFARRVLKCRNDFSNRVPLDVNATHLRTRMCGHRRQPVLSQEQTTCTKQERVNWIVFNKCLPG